MPFPVELPDNFAKHVTHSDSAQVGLFISSGSETNAEIAASAGFDWLLIDAEHSPYGLGTVTSLLRTVAAYPATPVVRIPVNDTVLIKQYLDLGAQSLMVPMVHNAEQAEKAVAAMHYPPRGVRGIGAALARSSRFNGVDDYLNKASETVSLTVQVESAEAVENAAEIAAVDGVDAIFIGPSDLAASMGLLGQQQHPDVLAAVDTTFKAVRDAGKLVGINAFNLEQAQAYIDAGASFVCVGADVQQLASATRALVEKFKG
ncbi:5-keto-4-deoxy-D-glucarate aldolase [Corynebacterium stationis]|uniref:5-keto-4-deoxy-D-glucarate aldolase n=1 Tax=Corynebacterium stationis TaxID=1705 RepID=A0A177IL99_9CORY|nr:aldolase/citrate lyase family protein [Corynebacterium stationis]OAH29639.1 5-keto-4-deoxy-D-glucarate aldolase [Corynebacterium stationis]